MTRDPAGAEIPRDPRLPQAIEIRVPGRTVRHAIDWNAMPMPEVSTPHAVASMYATAMANLEASLTERAILEGHDRIEILVEGRELVVKTVPSWLTETRKRIRVEWGPAPVPAATGGGDVKPLVYVAGPYSAPDPVVNTRRAIATGLELYDSGAVVPLIPHLSMLSHLIDPRPIDYWYRYDLDLLDHCAALLRIPGDSAGADAEVERAKVLELPVFRDVGEVLEWAKSAGDWPGGV